MQAVEIIAGRRGTGKGICVRSISSRDIPGINRRTAPVAAVLVRWAAVSGIIISAPKFGPGEFPIVGYSILDVNILSLVYGRGSNDELGHYRFSSIGRQFAISAGRRADPAVAAAAAAATTTVLN